MYEGKNMKYKMYEAYQKWNIRNPAVHATTQTS